MFKLQQLFQLILLEILSFLFYCTCIVETKVSFPLCFQNHSGSHFCDIYLSLVLRQTVSCPYINKNESTNEYNTISHCIRHWSLPQAKRFAKHPGPVPNNALNYAVPLQSFPLPMSISTLLCLWCVNDWKAEGVIASIWDSP